MPRSRSSRSSSPYSVSGYRGQSAQQNFSESETEREEIFQNVREMFSDTVGAEVIRSVLNECNWKGEDAIDKLLTIVPQDEGQKSRQSEFHQIAEGIFGSIRHADYVDTARHADYVDTACSVADNNGIQHVSSSPLTQSERVIKPPELSRSTEQAASQIHPASSLLEPSDMFPFSSPLSPRSLKPRLLATSRTLEKYGSEGDLTPLLHETQYPPVSLSKSAARSQSALASDATPVSLTDDLSSYRKYLEEAQTAYYHQDDDACQAQVWEKYKEMMGEHYFHTYTSVGNDTPIADVVNDIPIQTSTSVSKPLYGRTGAESLKHKPRHATDPEFATQKVVTESAGKLSVASSSRERTKQAGRNFPVRLLSRSPEGTPQKAAPSNVMNGKFSRNVDESRFNFDYCNRMDSADLDETVLKGINEVNDQLMTEIAQSSDIGGETGRSRSSTPDPSQPRTPTPNTQPMTLPVIGLSVEAPEFVPRPKKKKSEKSAEVSVARPISEGSKNKTKPIQRSKPIEVKRNVHVPKLNVQHTPVSSPNIIVGSPGMMGSPLGSPRCALSPTNPPILTANSAHLTGSPMFITPKWGHPVYHNIQTMHPPPPLPTQHFTPTPAPHMAHPPRYIGPLSPHNNAAYRVQVPPVSPLPYTSRVVFAGAPPPVFRVPGFPHMPRHSPISHPPPPLPRDLDNMAAIATGQPIMATGQVNANVVPPAGQAKPHPLSTNQSVAEQCIHRTRELQKGGNKVMVIIRGLPGSGKSTLARVVKLDGMILSTDDYFMNGNIYDYNPDRLSEAHQWNRERAREAIKLGTSPIVIDNTNTQKWEFKPHVNLALNNNYYVDIIEPDTPWKFRIKECARRTIHGVPEDHIERMLERYEHNITTEMLINRKTNENILTGDKQSDKTEKSEKSKNLKKSGRSNKNIVTKAKKINSKSAKNVKTEWDATWNENVNPKSKDQQQLNDIEVNNANLATDTLEATEGRLKPFLPIGELETEDSCVNNSKVDVNNVSEKLRNSAVFDKESKSSDSATERYLTSPMKNIPSAKPESGIGRPLESIDKAILSVGSILNVDAENNQNGSSKSSIDLNVLAHMSVANQINAPTQSDFSIQETERIYSSNSDMSVHSSVDTSPLCAFRPSTDEKYSSSNNIDASKPVIEDKTIQNVGITSSMITEIEEKLSEETLNFVREILAEHVGKNDMSFEETRTIEEELKALLQFYPIDDEQRIAAEQLIGYRLNYSGHMDDNDEPECAVPDITSTHADIAPVNIFENSNSKLTEHLAYLQSDYHDFLMSEHVETILGPEQGTGEFITDMHFKSEDLNNGKNSSYHRLEKVCGRNMKIKNDVPTSLLVENESQIKPDQDISDPNSYQPAVVPPKNEINSAFATPSVDQDTLSIISAKSNPVIVNTNSSHFPMHSHEDSFSTDVKISPVITGSENTISSAVNLESCDIRSENSGNSETDSDDEREMQLLRQNLARQKAMTAQEAEILKSMAANGEDVTFDLLNPEGNPFVVRAVDNHFTEAIKKEVNAALEEYERKYWGDEEDEEPVDEDKEKVDTVWVNDCSEVPWNQTECDPSKLVDTEAAFKAGPQRNHSHRLADKLHNDTHKQQLEHDEIEDREVTDNAECIKKSEENGQVTSLSPEPKNLETVVKSINIGHIVTTETIQSADKQSHNACFNTNDEEFYEHSHKHQELENPVSKIVDGELYNENDSNKNTAEIDTFEDNLNISEGERHVYPVGRSSIINAIFNDVKKDTVMKSVTIDVTDNIQMSAEIPNCSDNIPDEESVLSDNAIFISDDENCGDMSNEAVAETDREVNLKPNSLTDLPNFIPDEYMESMKAIASMGPIFVNTEEHSYMDNSLYVDNDMVYDNALLEHEIENSSLGMLINSYYDEDEQDLDSNVNATESVEASTARKVEESDIKSKSQEIPAASVPSSVSETTDATTIQIEAKTNVILQGAIGSSTDNTPSSSCNASPNINSRRKKQSKRKMAAKLEGPFLGSVDKEKFLAGNWSNLSLSPDQAFKNPNSSVIIGRNIEMSASYSTYCNQTTQTESGDFRVLNLLSQGEEFEYVNEYNFLNGRSKSISTSDCNSKNTDSEQVDIIPKMLRIDQSSSTDDLVIGSDVENLDFLKTCFPKIAADELECVLTNCADNVEWATNLLLDWKYSLELSEDEKQKFVDEVVKVRRSKSPVAVNMSEGEKCQPDSLLDSCFKLVEREKIATREEIEQQLIQTGKERLDRIEDDNITKIRLRRSTSLSEASLNSSKGLLNTSRYTADRLHRSVSSPAKSEQYHRSYSSQDGITDGVKFKSVTGSEKTSLSELNDSVFIRNEIETTGSLCPIATEKGDALSTAISVKDKDLKLKVTPHFEKFSTQLDTLDEISPIPKSSLTRIIFNHDKFKGDETQVEKVKGDIAEQTTESNTRDAASQADMMAAVEVEDIETAFQMNIATDVMKSLEQLYGPVDHHIGDGDIDVPIDHQTAWMLYQCLQRAVKNRKHVGKQQIIDDAAFARQLHKEQEALYHSPQKPVNGSRSRVPTPLQGLSIQGTIPGNKAFPVTGKPVRPLTEIMQEELAIQTSQEEHQRLAELEGGQNALATRVKRRKLYQTFPGIDTTVLNEVFQANRFNLTDTIVSISSSLGLELPPQMTREAEYEFEGQQDSMMEMVDGNTSSTPGPGGDYGGTEFDDYRDEADVHHRLRGECFHKAQDAYRKGLKQVASFYSQQGHLHTQKLKEANIQASEQILLDRSTALERNMTLDLHGLHVDEAIAALDRILPVKAKERLRSHLTVVTGRGSHSRGGVARLRPAVLAYLQRHQYSFNEPQPGAFRVLLRNR